MENPALPALAVSVRPIDSLKPHPRNSRVHPKLQLNRIAASLKEFGVVKPILIDGEGQVIAGHGVVAAAKLAGITQVPTVRVDHLNADQIRAYMLADNKLAELSDFDTELLASELGHLLSLDPAIDIGVTGFDQAEIELILEQAAQKHSGDDEFDSRDIGPSVSRLGQLWILGRHRVLCANALHNSAFKKLLAILRAGIVVVDPPFNCPVDGHVSGKGRVKHREFAMASGELTEAQFIRFLTRALRLLAAYSKPGSVQYVCIDWRTVGALLAAGKKAYSKLLNLCIWVKPTPGMGSFYRSQHEIVAVFRNGAEQHQNHIQLGRFGRSRSNVWSYTSPTSFGRHGEEADLLAQHPTPKPIAMIADALLDASSRGDLVLDSFLGSGSTLIAAERTGRLCYGIEIDPLYVDLTIRRFQRLTGEHAIDAVTGKSFDEIAQAEATHG